LGVEHQHHGGGAVLVILGDEEAAEPNRGTPVYVADPITRNERSDIARLEPFADARRHVVADEGLHPARPGQAAKRQRSRIYPKLPRHRDRHLSRLESGAVPQTGVDGPETHPASAHALDLVSPLDALT